MGRRVGRSRLATAVAGVLMLTAAASCSSDKKSTATTPAAATTAAQSGATTSAGGATTSPPSGATTSVGNATTSAAGATTSAAASGEKPKTGGTVTYFHTIDVRSFDPTQSGASAPGGDGWQRFPVFDALVYEDAQSGEIVPQTAESLESTDAKVWTLKLKPNIKFSDGTPYDAAAVKFNWDRIADPANKSDALSLVQSFESIQVLDPLTLQVTLKAPNGQFARIVARRLATSVGSPKALQADPAGFADKPVGAGPFLVKEFIRQNKITYVRNPTYWNAPRPYVDQLEIVLLPDDVQRFNALQSGQATMITDNTNANVNKQAKDAGYDVPAIADKVGAFVWLLNDSAPPFNDPVARQALAYATDKGNAIDTLFGGNGQPADFLIHDGSPFHDANTPLTPFNADKAKQLLQQLGKPLEFTINVSPSRLRYAEAWQTQLSAFPEIKATIQQIDPSQVVPTISQGQFQAVSFSFGGQDPEPDMYDHYHTGASRNYGKFSNPEMDKALETGRTSLDAGERKAAYATVQKIVADEVPDIWYTRNFYGYPHQKKLKDVTLTTTYALWDRLWLDS